jgi:hypothetical protein
MEKIRCIIASSPNGEREEVIFTCDLNSPASYFVTLEVDSDTVIEDVLPSSFPRDYRLIRK